MPAGVACPSPPPSGPSCHTPVRSPGPPHSCRPRLPGIIPHSGPVSLALRFPVGSLRPASCSRPGLVSLALRIPLVYRLPSPCPAFRPCSRPPVPWPSVSLPVPCALAPSSSPGPSPLHPYPCWFPVPGPPYSLPVPPPWQSPVPWPPPPCQFPAPCLQFPSRSRLRRITSHHKY